TGADRSDVAERRVKAVFARVLEMPEDLLDPRATFENYGVDSLVVLSLTKELEKEYGPLPSTLLFEHITIERLARHLAAAQGTDGGTPKTPSEPHAEPEAEHTAAPEPGIEQLVDSLSDAEVDSLLRQLSGALQDQEEQR
ncbi:acyl carrier protein, partial [Streptomyces flavofungini]|uniref:acyl carrier protein n=1 Tax=Streptomyces flavofungini TaxID=68200 RepID=UPI0034DE6BF0